MIYLPDVNFWIALGSDQHVHHAAAKNWFVNILDERLAFCRITELGFLRLLTNRHVMGEDALQPALAWQVLQSPPFRLRPALDVRMPVLSP